MFKNYLKTGWRNLIRNKIYSFIAITALALGMAVSILIFCDASDELAYNHNFPDSDFIFRLNARMQTENNTYAETWTKVPAPIGATALKSIPEVEKMARFKEQELPVVTKNTPVWEKKPLLQNLPFSAFLISPLSMGVPHLL